MGVENSVNRHNLSDLGVHMKLGKPVHSPTGKANCKGRPMGVQVKDTRKKRRSDCNDQNRTG